MAYGELLVGEGLAERLITGLAQLLLHILGGCLVPRGSCGTVAVVGIRCGLERLEMAHQPVKSDFVPQLVGVALAGLPGSVPRFPGLIRLAVAVTGLVLARSLVGARAALPSGVDLGGEGSRCTG